MKNIHKNTIICIFFLICLISFSGCNTITATSLTSNLKIKKIYIKKNDKVREPNVPELIQDSLLRYGIQSEVVDDIDQKKHEYAIRYSVLRAEDMVIFVRYAEMYLIKGDEIIRSAEFNSNIEGIGGLSFSKFKSTKSKINLLIDALLNESKD